MLTVGNKYPLAPCLYRKASSIDENVNVSENTNMERNMINGHLNYSLHHCTVPKTTSLFIPHWLVYWTCVSLNQTQYKHKHDCEIYSCNNQTNKSQTKACVSDTIQYRVQRESLHRKITIDSIASYRYWFLSPMQNVKR